LKVARRSIVVTMASAFVNVSPSPSARRAGLPTTTVALAV
jgi:hypothetical protein